LETVSQLAWGVIASVALIAPPVHGRAPAPASQATRVVPSGDEIIRQMHDRYAGKWYHNMTFVQTTTAWDSTGNKSVATWYESLQVPGTIRIDFAPRSDGNGVLATHDSTYIVQHGAVTTARAGGNILLTMAFDVYVAPVDHTVGVVRSAGYDLSKVHMDKWQGMSVYVIGADAGNLEAPQLWIDAKRLLLVRIFTPTKPGATTLRDIRFNQWRPIGGGWIAPNVEFYVGATRQRIEDYAGIKTDVTLNPELFDLAKWSTAAHWAP
jgi:hypothetical protein